MQDLRQRTACVCACVCVCVCVIEYYAASGTFPNVNTIAVVRRKPLTNMASLRMAIFVVCLFVVLLREIDTRAAKSGRTKKVRQPKVSMKTLAAKMSALETRLDDIEMKMRRVDQARGLFADDPPCPVKNTDGFNKSEETQSCYMMEPSSNMLNWTEAQTLCVSKHPKAHLVAIETEKEHNFLKAKWYNQCGISSLSRFWTDGSKLNRDNWYWVTGNNPIVLGFTNWIPTTSHNDNRFDCLAVYSNEAFGWGDVACWAPHVVTCEIEL